MGHDSDLLAASGSVGGPVIISNGDQYIDPHNAASFTTWAKADLGTGVSSQVIKDLEQTFKYFTGVTLGSRARTVKDVGSFSGTTQAFTFFINNVLIGLRAQSFGIQLRSANDIAQIEWGTNGLFVFDEGAGDFVNLGVSSITLGIKVKYTFVVNWTAGTLDAYVENTKIATGQAFGQTGSFVDGQMLITNTSTSVANQVSHIYDTLIGSGLAP